MGFEEAHSIFSSLFQDFLSLSPSLSFSPSRHVGGWDIKAFSAIICQTTHTHMHKCIHSSIPLCPNLHFVNANKRNKWTRGTKFPFLRIFSICHISGTEMRGKKRNITQRLFLSLTREKKKRLFRKTTLQKCSTNNVFLGHISVSFSYSSMTVQFWRKNVISTWVHASHKHKPTLAFLIFKALSDSALAKMRTK